MESKTFNLVDQTNLFKINYYKKSENMYNSENVLDGRIKKKYDFTGKQKFVSTPMSFSGGVGSGVLPKANAGKYEGAIITSKKVYATTEIDRETIKASANDAGSFVRATAESTKKTVESFMRNSSRILFGTGDGVLAKGNGAGNNVTGAGTEASPYVVQIPAAHWVEAKFEEKDYLQMVVAGSPEGADTTANLLEVVEVIPATRSIKLVGVSARLAALVAGPAPLAATDFIAMQRSYGKEPMGLKGIADASAAGTGSLYGIDVQRRWSMEVEDASGKGVSVDLLNKVILNTKKKFGKCGKLIMCGYAQYRNLLALSEDQKRYPIQARNIKDAVFSFEGVQHMTVDGAAGVFVDRMIEDDTIYILNEDFIERHHRPGFGWFDDDGTVFLRKTDSDEYEARYGGYFENFIVPTAHAVIRGLAV